MKLFYQNLVDIGFKTSLCIRKVKMYNIIFEIIILDFKTRFFIYYLFEFLSSGKYWSSLIRSKTWLN